MSVGFVEPLSSEKKGKANKTLPPSLRTGEGSTSQRRGWWKISIRRAGAGMRKKEGFVQFIGRKLLKELENKPMFGIYRLWLLTLCCQSSN